MDYLESLKLEAAAVKKIQKVLDALPEGMRARIAARGREAVSLAVYVAAPFARRPEVLALHGRLRAHGLEPTSTWATGTESEAELTPEMARRLIAQNDRDIARSSALLAIAYPGEGGEMFCEVTWAIVAGKPVYWVGSRRILSTWRPGVVVCTSVEDAIAKMKGRVAA